MRHLVTVAALFTLFTLHSQELDQVKQRLALPTATGAMVSVEEDPAAIEAIDSYLSQPQKGEFKGYRVGIFFDNSATARLSAQEARDLFIEKFPDVEVFMSYDNPYFKVAAGNCLEQEEAAMLLHRVQRHFPKAYLMREQMSAEDLILVEPVDSLSQDEELIESDSSKLAENRALIDSLTLELERLSR